MRDLLMLLMYSGLINTVIATEKKGARDETYDKRIGFTAFGFGVSILFLLMLSCIYRRFRLVDEDLRNIILYYQIERLETGYFQLRNMDQLIDSLADGEVFRISEECFNKLIELQKDRDLINNRANSARLNDREMIICILNDLRSQEPQNVVVNPSANENQESQVELGN